MRLYTSLPLLYFISSVAANRAVFSDVEGSQVCAGIYAKHDYGGIFKPHIELLVLNFGDLSFLPNLTQNIADDIEISYIIFEYKDYDKIGFSVDDGLYKYICDDYAISHLHACNESQRGSFIVSLEKTNNTILTSTLKGLGLAHINYTINNTGYYCVSTFRADGTAYKGVINFQNAFGHLSASEIPKLPAYGILTLCYAIALALFGFQFFKKRKQNQILPLQRYLLVMLAFLTFDTLVVWSYYDLLNQSKNPSTGFVICYGVFLAVLNSVKISLSFFLLLCIALGYGVVVVKLPKKVMRRCKLLAGALFASALFYLIVSYNTSSTLATVSTSSLGDNSAGSLLGLLSVIPIAVCMTGSYIAIMVNIRITTLKLHQQRQVIKLQLYENLFRIIFLSFFCTFTGLTVSSFILLSLSSTDMIEAHWKGAYFVYEFWPSIVYFVVFMGVAWLWRPTESSYMLAISQQLQSGADIDHDGEVVGGNEFELDDMSLMSHSDNEQTNSRTNFSGENISDNDSFELDSSIRVKDSYTQEPPLYHYGQGHSDESSNTHTLFNVGFDEADDEDDSKLHDNPQVKDSKKSESNLDSKNTERTSIQE